MSPHTAIIQSIIQKKCFNSYLEIGVHIPADNFDLIKCRFKIGVDPNGRANFTGTSDEFFEMVGYEREMCYKLYSMQFDLIFIDGLHHYEQVKKDLENALQCLNYGGIIVIHDTNPAEERYTAVPRLERGRWNGDVYRVLPDLKNFDFVTCDWEANGVTVVKPGGTLLEHEEITYQQFNENRIGITKLVNRQQFEEWI